MGTLFIVATPIGHVEDITIRALKTLFTVDFIACEDTRRTGQLLKIYESRVLNKEWNIQNVNILKTRRFISYYDEVEEVKSHEIVNLLEEGKSVALVSDSGTPLISDPGFKLVAECIKHNINVISIPGPTALITSLTVSGFSSNQFLFLGYLPSKKSSKIKLLKEIKELENYKFIKPTIIFYESPFRIYDSLSDLKEIFGDKQIVISREMTKMHEETLRGKISVVLPKTKKLKGELTIIFAY